MKEEIKQIANDHRNVDLPHERESAVSSSTLWNNTHTEEKVTTLKSIPEMMVKSNQFKMQTVRKTPYIFE